MYRGGCGEGEVVWGGGDSVGRADVVWGGGTWCIGESWMWQERAPATDFQRAISVE